MLYRLMADEGVRVVSNTSEGDGSIERRDWQSALGTAAGIYTLVVQGAVPAVKKALAKFRQQQPDAKVEAKDDDGQPFGYL
jgi:hypothetical protein